MGSILHINAFSERLMMLRRKKGLAQDELAQKIGVSSKTINSWEGGKFANGGGLKVANIIALCNALGCDFDYLFGKIDLPTKIDTDIQTETGLSERAIDRLRDEGQESRVFRETLSELIESPLFYSLVLGIADYKRYMSFSPEMRADVGSENISISDLSRMITPAGWAVLSSGDAAEYWLQRAYETFCNMAREIWMKEGDGNNGK